MLMTLAQLADSDPLKNLLNESERKCYSPYIFKDIDSEFINSIRSIIDSFHQANFDRGANKR